MKSWTRVGQAALAAMLGAGAALGGTPAASSAPVQVSASNVQTVPRALPRGGVEWNVPAAGLTWTRLRGKVVLIDFWNHH